jgi:DNA polymerase-3 subunit alpha
METLVLDDPILVHGRLEVGEERVQIIANEVTPMAQASRRASPGSSASQPERAQNGDRIHFYVRGEEVTSEELGRLHETLLRYPGPCTVFLHLALPDKSETVIELPIHLKVARTPELLETVESLFGNRISPLRSL